ncbi:MAG TPA: peptide chain release factor-like protein [Candidatus Binatia bacterium]|jgi:protein subunit release factor B|nr:peptide chain release factor-like protein [Candidatus Binatia bacterium]
MPRFPVSSEKERQLVERMAALEIREEDIEEQFVRSSGAGGQNVNKVSSCVLLHHRPSGVRVRCQKERSQGLNRFLARRILLEKIESLRRGAAVEAQQRIAKIRRQKRRRSRRAKLRLIEEKRRRGETKTLRSAVRPDTDDS